MSLRRYSQCVLPELPVPPPHGGTGNHAPAAFSTLRAQAERKPNLQNGLGTDLSRADNERWLWAGRAGWITQAQVGLVCNTGT